MLEPLLLLLVHPALLLFLHAPRILLDLPALRIGPRLLSLELTLTLGLLLGKVIGKHSATCQGHAKYEEDFSHFKPFVFRHSVPLRFLFVQQPLQHAHDLRMPLLRLIIHGCLQASQDFSIQRPHIVVSCLLQLFVQRAWYPNRRFDGIGVNWFLYGRFRHRPILSYSQLLQGKATPVWRH